MKTFSLRLFRLAGLAGAVSLVASAQIAMAQGARSNQNTVDGDGLVHGAEVLPVVRAPLRPGQITTLNLHPYEHAILEFPYPVVRVDGGMVGDSSIFVADKFGNKMTMTASSLTSRHTTMSVVLGDADLTTVMFNVTTDPSKPMSKKITYYDSAATIVDNIRTEIKAQESAKEQARIDQLAETRLRQRLLMASVPTAIEKSASTGVEGNRLTLFIESAQSVPTGDGGPAKLYIRYRFVNGGLATVSDLHFSARRVQEPTGVFGKETATDLYDLSEERTAQSIPGGTAVIGLIVMEQPDLAPGERLDITAKAFRDQKSVTVTGALVGPAKR